MFAHNPLVPLGHSAAIPQSHGGRCGSLGGFGRTYSRLVALILRLPYSYFGNSSSKPKQRVVNLGDKNANAAR
jgi:hypothetical protein